MFEDFLAVTNRALCRQPFLTQIEQLAQTDVKAIILREKDLDHAEYEKLAGAVLAICDRYGKPCILHGDPKAARHWNQKRIHLPFPAFSHVGKELAEWEVVGTSVHSVKEAVLAEQAGAGYLIAGHIFETDCKAGLPGRGLDFLKQVCEAVSVPVYGIGGITPERLPLLKEAGAAGGCMMSYFMRL